MSALRKMQLAALRSKYFSGFISYGFYGNSPIRQQRADARQTGRETADQSRFYENTSLKGVSKNERLGKIYEKHQVHSVYNCIAEPPVLSRNL